MKHKPIKLPTHWANIDTGDRTSEVDAYLCGYTDAICAVRERMRNPIQAFVNNHAELYRLNLDYVNLFEEISRAIEEDK